MALVALAALDLRDTAVDHGDHDVPGLAAATALRLDVRPDAHPISPPRCMVVLQERRILAALQAKG
jgi:hypothetical protein